MPYFYGLIAFDPDPERLPWCVRQGIEDAEYSALIHTEYDAKNKQRRRLIYAVWDLDSGEIVSISCCGKTYRLLCDEKLKSEDAPQ